MAQTKKQRFRAQKRVAKTPAPKPVATKVAKTAEGSGTDKKKIIIGVGALVALAGVAGTILLLANPFASPVEAVATAPVATTPPLVQQEMSPEYIRSMLIREYRVRVDQALSSQVFESCESGNPVSGSGNIRGKAIPITVTCMGTKLKVVNADTKVEIPPGG
jgi:hypothetical protein